MKIQSKITLHFLALSTGILVLLNAFIFYFEYQFNYRDFFKRLQARVKLTSDIQLFPGEKARAYQEMRERFLEKLQGETEYVIKSNASGVFENMGLPKDFFTELIRNGNAEYKKDNQFFAGKIVARGDERFIVAVSARNAYGLEEIEELKEVLIFGFLGTLIVVFFVGKVFSFYTFAPVRNLTNRMNEITSNNLHLRLENSGKDELAELSDTFNDMLMRLETAFETQNNFVSNASHELRTPLTIINSEVELALNKAGNDSEYRQMLDTIQTETNKLTQILNSLLLLAQSGFDGKKQDWQHVRIDEAIWQAIESVNKIQPQSQIGVDFSKLPDNEQMLEVLGNSNLLHLAITNIVSNSCKYSENKLVTIQLSVEKAMVVIGIKDQGIGIPADDMKHVFVPFFRASNTQDFKGHGVGLPLALNIIRLHRGSIGINSEINIGTEIKIFLPSVGV